MLEERQLEIPEREKPPDDIRAIQKLNLIAKLYQILSKKEGDVCFSPFGVFWLLSVADQLAEGQTVEVLSEILKFGEIKWETEKFKRLIHELDKPWFMKFQAGNKVFINKSAGSKHVQLEVRENSDESVEIVDFHNKSEAVDKINEWLMNETKNEMKGVIDTNFIDERVSLLFINTMYIVGELKYMFDEKLVTTQPFYLDESNKIDIRVMKDHKLYCYKYHEELKAKIIYIPYKHFLMHLVVILPDERTGLQELEKKLTKVNLYDVVNNVDVPFCNINVSIPLCLIQQIVDINEFLPEMGLQELFEDKNISFKQIIKLEKFENCCEDRTGKRDFNPDTFTPRLNVEDVRKVDFIIDHPVVYMLTARYLPLENLLFFGRFSHPKQ